MSYSQIESGAFRALSVGILIALLRSNAARSAARENSGRLRKPSAFTMSSDLPHGFDPVTPANGARTRSARAFRCKQRNRQSVM